MTAYDLIADIFARPQQSIAPNMRRVTEAQLRYLRDLIAQDEDGAAVVPGSPGSLIWSPPGRWRYVLTEDLNGNKRTLTRLARIDPRQMDSLF